MQAKEVVGNICGRFLITINELNSEELDNTQFSPKETTKIKGGIFATKNNLFRFVLEVVDGQKIILFALFEESLVPYIGTLMKSEVTQMKHQQKKNYQQLHQTISKKKLKQKKPKKSSSISLDEELTQEEIKRKKTKKDYFNSWNCICCDYINWYWFVFYGIF